MPKERGLSSGRNWISWTDVILSTHRAISRDALQCQQQLHLRERRDVFFCGRRLSSRGRERHDKIVAFLGAARPSDARGNMLNMLFCSMDETWTRLVQSESVIRKGSSQYLCPRPLVSKLLLSPVISKSFLTYEELTIKQFLNFEMDFVSTLNFHTVLKLRVRATLYVPSQDCQRWNAVKHVFQVTRVQVTYTHGQLPWWSSDGSQSGPLKVCLKNQVDPPQRQKDPTADVPLGSFPTENVFTIEAPMWHVTWCTVVGSLQCSDALIDSTTCCAVAFSSIDTILSVQAALLVFLIVFACSLGGCRAKLRPLHRQELFSVSWAEVADDIFGAVDLAPWRLHVRAQADGCTVTTQRKYQCRTEAVSWSHHRLLQVHLSRLEWLMPHCCPTTPPWPP